MISITRVLEFDMGHRIPDHQSKCRFLHGHRYRAEFTVGGPLIEGGPSSEMVLDFGDIKRAMVEVIEGGFDHQFALYQADPIRGQWHSISMSNYGIIVLPVIPTVQNLAKLLGDVVWEKLSKMVGENQTYSPSMTQDEPPEPNIFPLAFKLFETPNCWAVYNFQSS